AHAECVFKPGHALAGGRGGDALHAAGVDEAAGVRGVDEGLQVGQVVEDGHGAGRCESGQGRARQSGPLTWPAQHCGARARRGGTAQRFRASCRLRTFRSMMHGAPPRFLPAPELPTVARLSPRITPMTLALPVDTAPALPAVSALLQAV